MCLVLSSLHIDCFMSGAENVQEYQQKYFSLKSTVCSYICFTRDE